MGERVPEKPVEKVPDKSDDKPVSRATPAPPPKGMVMTELAAATKALGVYLDQQSRLLHDVEVLRACVGGDVQLVLEELTHLDERRAALAAEVGTLEARLVTLKAEVGKAEAGR